MKRNVSSWLPICLEAATAIYQRVNRDKKRGTAVAVYDMAEPMAEYMAAKFGKLETGWVEGTRDDEKDHYIQFREIKWDRDEVSQHSGRRPVRVRAFRDGNRKYR